MKIQWQNQRLLAGSPVEPGITCLDWMPWHPSTASSTSSDDSHTKSCCTGGYLSAGSESGVVGITYTDLRPCDKKRRINFNVRAHHCSVSKVVWNQSLGKLASCDVNGTIYVWSPGDERWSVELVNDRGVKVRDVVWNATGTAALICYEDNFVLIGSASGQRVWSHPFTNEIRCGCWHPDGRGTLIGCADGTVIHLNDQGTPLYERTIFEGIEMRQMVASPKREDGKWTIAALAGEAKLDTDNIVALWSDNSALVEKVMWKSPKPVHLIQWNASGTLLAVVCKSRNLYILTHKGEFIYRCKIPVPYMPPPPSKKNEERTTPYKPDISAFTWMHGDHSVIAAAKGVVTVGRVIPGVPTLHRLVSFNLWNQAGCSMDVITELPLPRNLKTFMEDYTHNIVACRIPLPEDVAKAVCEPTEHRWYCTIKPHKEPHKYLMCVEHMGGLVPLLVGHQTNKIVPHFLITLYDAEEEAKKTGLPARTRNGPTAQVEDIEPNQAVASETPSRNTFWRRSKRRLRKMVQRQLTSRNGPALHSGPLLSLKRRKGLVQVSSNPFCTRFKVSSVISESTKDLELPRQMAYVSYKTSVLHLQPRQMTVNLLDMTEQEEVCSSYKGPTPKEQAIQTVPEERMGEDRVAAVAPADVANARNVHPPEEESQLAEEELTPDESAYVDDVVNEYTDLRQAVNRHIEQMKEFADVVEKAAVTSSTKEPPAAGSRDSWLSELDKLEYIDDAEEPETESPRTTDKKTLLPVPRTLAQRSASPKGRAAQPEQQSLALKSRSVASKTRLMSALGRLRKLAASLIPHRRQTPAEEKDLPLIAEMMADSLPQPSSSSPSTPEPVTASTQVRRPGSAGETSGSADMWRAQMRDIADAIYKMEAQLENSDAIEEVRTDLRQRAERIKTMIGEHGTVDKLAELARQESERQMLTMKNKTPFWNEQNQVYQLDFGGRVTQESAKNFQIEFNDRQVMQFGRIENGCYTLDFCAPFSAAQAFAIALASITQRLK
ncbi:hypothetical protein QR680_008161 [Steinernema hermaphroditum]|uniref:Tubby C-terminal domain-containing protein n=1 Tax=Steinernema hermaphroditum TaxID=289476 RepID=A0AA39IFL9_9BILA|nr:hypothetical protein QR680_008161 [Steinernema hermaphroditum]